MDSTKLVYVVDWNKHYSDITKWDASTGKRECIFPIKTPLPDYCGIEHHWKYKYEDNLTLKGTINKREPRKLVEKIPVYKNYKWEIIEIFKHPKAGKLHYDLDQYTQEQLDTWKDYSRYTEENLLLLASTHTEKAWMKCYIIIAESGVSEVTPEQYADKQFDAFVEANLGKWDRNTINKKDVPKELISRFYDEHDKALFGTSWVKALVSYEYIDGKFSIDGKHIFVCSSISYDGKGNVGCPNPELIKSFTWIKNYIEGINQ